MHNNQYFKENKAIEKLLTTVQGVWNGQSEIDGFRKVLQDKTIDIEHMLSNPTERTPNPVHKKEIESLKVMLPERDITLIKEEAERVLKLSLDLNLDEWDSLRIFWIANEQCRDSPPNSIADIIIMCYTIYFDRRSRLLTALLDLVLMYNSNDLSKGLVTIANEYISDLVRKGNLIVNLTQLLEDLFKLKLTAYQGKIEDLILLIVQILFSLFVQHETTTTEMSRLIQLLRSRSNILVDPQQNDNTQKKFISHICFMLWSTFVGALQLKYDPLASDSTPPQNLDEFIRKIRHEQKNWKNKHFKACFLLSWSLFLEHTRSIVGISTQSSSEIQRLCNEALLPGKSNVFTFLLKDFISTPGFVKFAVGANGNCMIEVISLLLSGFIKTFNQKLQNIFHHDERNFTGNEDIPSVAFLSVLTQLCKLSPPGGAMVSPQNLLLGAPDEDINPSFEKLLALNDSRDRLTLQLQSPLLEVYVTLFESLCHNNHTRRAVYELLNRSSQRLSWSEFFKAFKKVYRYFQPISRQHHQHHGIPNQKAPRLQPQISAKEVKIVKCMLRLVKAVAVAPLFQQVSEKVKLMFDLMSCRFPNDLKACVLDAITAFASSDKDVAIEVWQRLQESQILPTQQSSTASNGNNRWNLGQAQQPPLLGYDRGFGMRHPAMGMQLIPGNNHQSDKTPDKTTKLQGLFEELRIEKEAELYPLMIAFSRLILALLHSVNLPPESAKEIYKHSIRFILQELFLKLDERQYHHLQERWILAEICLAIFCKLLTTFVPEEQDFRTQDVAPEFEIMDSLFRVSSRLFRRILGLIGETYEKYLVEPDQYIAREEQKIEIPLEFVESTLLFSLKFLSLALNMEDAFIFKLRKARKHATPTLISASLVARKEVITIAKAVSYKQTNVSVPTMTRQLIISSSEDFDSSTQTDAELALYASRIIYYLSNGDDNGHMLMMFDRENHSIDIIRAFAIQLQHTPQLPYNNQNLVDSLLDTPMEGADQSTFYGIGSSLIDGEVGQTGTHFSSDKINQARICILEILLSNLSINGQPNLKTNLAHFLLGFDTASPDAVRMSGFASNPSNRGCLKDIVSLVQQPRFSVQNPILAECCYELFYRLCSNPLTSRPFLAWLSREDLHFFFFDLLETIPRKTEKNILQFVLQRSWIMKAIALQLHLISRKANHYNDAYLKRLGFIQDDAESYEDQFDLRIDEDIEQGSMKILELLESINVILPENPVPIPPEMGVGRLKTNSCMRLDPSQQTFQYDLKAFYLLCRRAMRDEQPTPGSQRDSGLALGGAPAPLSDMILTEQDAKRHYKNALQWNDLNALIAACKLAFNGWKQIVEICLYVCFDPKSRPDHYELILFELLTGILQKLTSTDRIWTCLGESLSKVALTVMAKIRQHAGLTTGWKTTQQRSVLELVLQGITNNWHNTTRSHLYGTFLNYMQYTHDIQSYDLNSIKNANEPDLHMTNDMYQLEASNLELLEKYGPQLIEIVVQDATKGRARLRSMAFVFLNCLLVGTKRVDEFQRPRYIGNGSASWLYLLMQKRAIESFVSTLHIRNDSLEEAVKSPQCKHYDQILNYESMMYFLIKLSEMDRRAVQHLIDGCKVVKILSNCTFIDPPPSAYSSPPRNAPKFKMTGFFTTQERYYQVLVPALRLIVTLLTAKPYASSGKHGDCFQNLHQDTLNFLSRQKDTLLTDTPISMSTLRILKLKTTALYFLHHGPLWKSHRKEIENMCSTKLLSILYTRYANPLQSSRLRAYIEKTKDTSASISDESESFIVDSDVEDIPNLINEISRNLVSVLLCRIEVADPKNQFNGGIRPSATIVNIFERSTTYEKDRKNLGVLIMSIEQSITNLKKEFLPKHFLCQQTIIKFNNMSWKELLSKGEQLNIDLNEHGKLTIEMEQKELGPREMVLLRSGDNPQKRVQIYNALKSQLQLFSNRIKLAFYIIEATFQLLYRHVEFYTNVQTYQDDIFNDLISNLEHLLQGDFPWISSYTRSSPTREEKNHDDEVSDVRAPRLFGKVQQDQCKVFKNDSVAGHFLPRSAWQPYHRTFSRSPIKPRQIKSKFPFDVDLHFLRELLRKFKHSVSAGDYPITSHFVGIH